MDGESISNDYTKESLAYEYLRLIDNKMNVFGRKEWADITFSATKFNYYKTFCHGSMMKCSYAGFF